METNVEGQINEERKRTEQINEAEKKLCEKLAKVVVDTTVIDSLFAFVTEVKGALRKLDNDFLQSARVIDEMWRCVVGNTEAVIKKDALAKDRARVLTAIFVCRIRDAIERLEEERLKGEK